MFISTFYRLLSLLLLLEWRFIMRWDIINWVYTEWILKKYGCYCMANCLKCSAGEIKTKRQTGRRWPSPSNLRLLIMTIDTVISSSFLFIYSVLLTRTHVHTQSCARTSHSNFQLSISIFVCLVLINRLSIRSNRGDQQQQL